MTEKTMQIPAEEKVVTFFETTLQKSIPKELTGVFVLKDGTTISKNSFLNFIIMYNHYYYLSVL